MELSMNTAHAIMTEIRRQVGTPSCPWLCVAPSNRVIESAVALGVWEGELADLLFMLWIVSFRSWEQIKVSAEFLDQIPGVTSSLNVGVPEIAHHSKPHDIELQFLKKAGNCHWTQQCILLYWHKFLHVLLIWQNKSTVIITQPRVLRR